MKRMKPIEVVLTTLAMALGAACDAAPEHAEPPVTPAAPLQPVAAPPALTQPVPAPAAAPTASADSPVPTLAPSPPATPTPAPIVMPPVPPDVNPAIAAIEWLGTLSEVTAAHVDAAFPGHEISDNGLEGYTIRKDGKRVGFVAVADHRLVEASLADRSLTVEGIRRDASFSVVTELPDIACRHEPGEDCTVHCRSPSGWRFGTTVRCKSFDFSALTLAKAKALTRGKRVEWIVWSAGSE